MLNRLQDASRPFSPSRRPATRRANSVSGAQDLDSPSTEDTAARKVCIVEFRSGEAVNRHPDLKCFLNEGWEVDTAVPQLTDKQRVELLVVMSRGRAERSDSV